MLEALVLCAAALFGALAVWLGTSGQRVRLAQAEQRLVALETQLSATREELERERLQHVTSRATAEA